MRISVAVCLLAIAHVGAQNLLENPGFEPPARDGLAEHWLPNVWGECDTRFSLDRNHPHLGETCQKIECVKRVNGASQFLQPLAIEANKKYTVRVWVRAAGKVPFVGVALRQSPAPYRKHLRATIEPGRDWELLEAEAVSLQDEDNAGLYIWFEADGSGTVWVDDAFVSVSDPPAMGGPPPEGNVVPNGSFEVDPTRTWDNTGIQADWPCEAFVQHGKRSLHVSFPKEGAAVFRTPCLEFNGNGDPFSLACSARATGGPVRLTLKVQSAVRSAGARSLLRLDATPGTDLKRYSVREALPQSANGAYYLQLRAEAEAPGEIWIDAVSLMTDGDDYTPAGPLAAALSTAVPAGIFAPGEPVSVRLDAAAGAPGYRGDVRVTVRDYSEDAVCVTRIPLRLGAHAAISRDIVLPVDRLGAFRADVVRDGSPEVLASMVFSVIPMPASVPVERSVVGGHFATSSDWQMQVAQRLGYHWTRIHDCSSITHWRTAEPEQEQWQFYDEQVRRVREAGLGILGEFLRVPDWATAAAEGTDDYKRGVGPPRDLAAFANYVHVMVDHYKEHIHHWEIWNEPYGKGFWGGTPEQYAELSTVAVRAARQADPTCKLLGPSIHPASYEWFESAAEAGAIQHVDIFSYHGYGLTSPVPYQTINNWAGKDGGSLPRWNTETGVTAASFYVHLPDKLDSSYTRWLRPQPVETAVANAVKLFALSIAGGAERYFYYWTNVETGMCPRLSSMSIYEFDRTIRPHGVAFAIAGSLLDPCEGKGILELGEGIVACLLARDDATVAVLFAASKLTSGAFDVSGLPRDTRLLDVMGNPTGRARNGRLRAEITRTPCYLVCPRIKTDPVSRALQDSFR